MSDRSNNFINDEHQNKASSNGNSNQNLGILLLREGAVDEASALRNDNNEPHTQHDPCSEY